MTWQFSSPELQAALITSVGSVVAAVIAAIAAAVIGRQISGKRRLQEALKLAIDDVHFLLAVEAEHCRIHQEESDESFKNRAREVARDSGYSWSAQYTPGRVQGSDLYRKL